MRYLYRFKQLILLAGDFIIMVCALLLSSWIRNATIPLIEKIQELLIGFVLVFLLWLVINYIVGLYDLRVIHTGILFRRVSETAVSAFIIGILFFYISPEKNIAPKTLLLLTVIIGYTLIYIWRHVYPHIIGDQRFSERLLMLGTAPEADELLRIVNTEKSLGYELAQTLHLNLTIQTLSTYIADNHITTIVVAQDVSHIEHLEDFLYTCLFEHITIVDFTTFYEQVTGRVPPSAFSKSWFLNHIQTADKPLYRKTRRLLDIGAAILGGLVMLVLSIIIVPLIKLTSRGPVLFHQKRVGAGGKTFWMYKFRTMYVLAADGSAEVAGAQFALRDDKRVTSIGKFLRKTRIDELPQIINLIKGELTLIGPRPERPEIVTQLIDHMPYYTLRHVVTPGLTGWAQIHQHYTDTLETSLQKLQYDLFYIKNRSLLLDLSIMLKTINVVLRGLGQ